MVNPNVGVLRPDDYRIAEAVEYLQSRSVTPIADPMLTIQPTRERPLQAEYYVFTSPRGVRLAIEQGWTPEGGTVCAIGEQTAAALADQGYPADIVPSLFTSRGLVEAIADEVKGHSIEVARSAHGSDELVQGLERAGAEVHETHLYRLERPATAGRSVSLAAEGRLDGILFSSPKTVHHFFEIAQLRDETSVIQLEFDETIVGAIGAPTKRTVNEYRIEVDAIPDTVDFTTLADLVVTQIKGRRT